MQRNCLALTDGSLNFMKYEVTYELYEVDPQKPLVNRWTVGIYDDNGDLIDWDGGYTTKEEAEQSGREYIQCHN